MRLRLLLICLLLGGCAGANPNSLVGAFSVDARKKMDDEKCREFGYQKGTEGYAQCRLELERARAISQTGTRINLR